MYNCHCYLRDLYPEHSYDEYNEELENDAFRELEAGLNDQTFQNKDAPPQLTAVRCTGIGSPKKVWPASLSCIFQLPTRCFRFGVSSVAKTNSYVRVIVY